MLQSGRWAGALEPASRSRELYRAILEGKPYPVRGLIGFGANMLLAHADGRSGREALAALDFYVHADLFMNPTAELADIVLPVASPFEREALKIGFEISPEAQSLVQLRPAVVPPPGRGALRYRHRLRPRRPPRPRRAFLGRRHRGGLPPRSWRHPA